MQAKPEFRKSERFGHQSIIKLEDDLTLSPYYAVSSNLSETGMYFKSLFKMYPGAHVLVKIEDDSLTQNKVSAKVVWCKELKNSKKFRYGVGVEFLPLEKNFGFKEFLPITPQMKTSNMNRDGAGVVIGMEKR